MNREVAKLFEEAKSKMSGYVALFSYRLGNLCIKAEPVSLLSIDVLHDGSIAKFEDAAEALKPDDYHFIIIPKSEGILFSIAKSIKRVHPEFKLEIKSVAENDSSDDTSDKYKYIHVEMPEVNKDRHDALKEATEILYKECKTREDGIIDLYSAKIKTRLEGYPKEAFDEMEDKMETFKSQIFDLMNKNFESKLTEIDLAYNSYIKKQEDQQQKKQADDKSKGRNAGMSMKLYEDDDE